MKRCHYHDSIRGRVTRLSRLNTLEGLEGLEGNLTVVDKETDGVALVLLLDLSDGVSPSQNLTADEDLNDITGENDADKVVLSRNTNVVVSNEVSTVNLTVSELVVRTSPVIKREWLVAHGNTVMEGVILLALNPEGDPDTLVIGIRAEEDTEGSGISSGGGAESKKLTSGRLLVRGAVNELRLDSTQALEGLVLDAEERLLLEAALEDLLGDVHAKDTLGVSSDLTRVAHNTTPHVHAVIIRVAVADPTEVDTLVRLTLLLAGLGSIPSTGIEVHAEVVGRAAEGATRRVSNAEDSTSVGSLVTGEAEEPLALHLVQLRALRAVDIVGGIERLGLDIPGLKVSGGQETETATTPHGTLSKTDGDQHEVLLLLLDPADIRVSEVIGLIEKKVLLGVLTDLDRLGVLSEDLTVLVSSLSTDNKLLTLMASVIASIVKVHVAIRGIDDTASPDAVVVRGLGVIDLGQKTALGLRCPVNKILGDIVVPAALKTLILDVSVARTVHGENVIGVLDKKCLRITEQPVRSRLAVRAIRHGRLINRHDV